MIAPARAQRDPPLRCPHCGGDLVLTPEGEWVCRECGTVYGPHLFLAPARPQPIQGRGTPLFLLYKRAAAAVMRRFANCRGVLYITPRLVRRYGGMHCRGCPERAAECGVGVVVDGILAVPCEEIPRALARLERC